jgi:hypothetical protein
MRPSVLSLSRFVPKVIEMQFDYYQITVSRKRIVRSTVVYGNFCTISTSQSLQNKLATLSPPVLPCQDNDTFYVLEVRGHKSPEPCSLS